MSCTCTKSELMWCCLNIKCCVRIYFGSISNKIVYCGETRIINTVSNLYPADEKAKMEQVACVILAESHTIHNVFL